MNFRIRKSGRSAGWTNAQCKSCERCALMRFYAARPGLRAQYRKDYRKRDRQRNPKKHAQWRRRAYHKDIEHSREVQNAWVQKNPDKCRATRRRHYAVSPTRRIIQSLRVRVYILLRGKSKKSARTLELLGCDKNFLLTHLEARFQPGMSWENWGKGAGKWEIDHVRPCASFSDLTDPEQLAQCCHYSNLQPMWGRDNVIKGAKYEGVDYRGK